MADTNLHAELARERKAQELAAVLLHVPATWASMVRSLLEMEEEGEATDPWFRTVEEHAGTTEASRATWERVAEILAERAERARARKCLRCGTLWQPDRIGPDGICVECVKDPNPYEVRP